MLYIKRPKLTRKIGLNLKLLLTKLHFDEYSDEEGSSKYYLPC